MPATMLVMYGTPTDPAAFSKEYAVHIPLAQKIPGLRTFEVSRDPIGTPAGPRTIRNDRAVDVRLDGRPAGWT